MQHPTEVRIVCWRNKLEENLPNPGNRKLKKGKKKWQIHVGMYVMAAKWGRETLASEIPRKIRQVIR